MEDQKKKTTEPSSSGLEDMATSAARKAKRYMITRDTLASLKKQQKERRRCRRFAINTEILEVNGRPSDGATIIDLSMNGARVQLPFSLPFMSQLTMKFTPPGSTIVFSVVGRIIWSKLTFRRGWHEVGVQFYQNYWELDNLLQLQKR